MTAFAYLLHAEGYECEEEYDHLLAHGVFLDRDKALEAAKSVAQEAVDTFEDGWDDEETTVVLEWEEEKQTWLVRVTKEETWGTATLEWTRIGIAPMEVKG